VDVSYQLAENISNVSYSDLNPTVVDITKKNILDTFGCMIAASTLSLDSLPVIDMVRKAGGSGEAGVIGFPDKIPVWMAAFANGILAHALDYDDIVNATSVHPSMCTIPAAFALAEKTGGVSGKEFITAVALGNDLICRLGYAIKNKAEGMNLGFRPAPVLGVFGAAAAAGKVLKLNQQQIVDALGIVFHQGAAGTIEAFLSPGDTKIRDYYGGFIGLNGVLAALLSQMGITGIKTCFEGPAGLFSVYFNNKYDRDYLVADLGIKFDGVQVSVKPWPANIMMHNYIYATLQLGLEADIGPDDIDKIIIYVGEPFMRFADGDKKVPKTGNEARISLPFCVGACAARRELKLWNFTPDGLADDLALDMAQKVEAVVAETVDQKSFVQPAKVEIIDKRGKRHIKQVDHSLGHPDNPLDFRYVANKFRDCVSYSANLSVKNKTESIIELIQNIDQVEDIREFSKLFS